MPVGLQYEICIYKSMQLVLNSIRLTNIIVVLVVLWEMLYCAGVKDVLSVHGSVDARGGMQEAFD